MKNNTIGFQVHYGAGKLTCGFLLRLFFNQNRPFLVVQRRSWEKVLKKDDIHISENKKRIGSLRVIKQKKVALDSIKEPSILFVDDLKDSASIVKQTNCLSCSLGTKGLASLKGVLKRHAPKNSVLYAFENDASLVETVRAELQEKTRVLFSLVDRICSKRTVHSSGIISTNTEKWRGQVIVQDTGLLKASDVVKIAPSKELFAFYKHKKLSLVNSIHTVFAFVTLLIEKRRRGVIDLYTGYPIIPFDEMPVDCKNAVKAWIAMNIFLLIRDHSTLSSIDSIEEMLGYAMNSVKRFSDTFDTTKRVLNAGIKKRFDKRIKLPRDRVFSHAHSALGQIGKKMNPSVSIDCIKKTSAEFLNNISSFCC